jgi:hypothetical protein
VVTEDLVRYYASDHTVRAGQGPSFDGLQELVASGPQAGQTLEAIDDWSSGDGRHVARGSLDAFFAYERVTRVVGPLFAALVALALAGLVLARGVARRGAWLFALVAAVSILGPPVMLFYAARYAVPAFGPLAAAAAVGGWAVSERLASRGRARPGPR